MSQDNKSFSFHFDGIDRAIVDALRSARGYYAKHNV